MTDSVGRRLAGRTPGVHLNEVGREQAEQLAERLAARLAGEPVSAMYSSPLERARETAEPLARRMGLATRVVGDLGEIHYGTWTDQSLTSLAADSAWKRFNILRSVARIPGGELMLQAQARAVGALEQIRSEFPDGQCVVVSHGDVIRGLIAHYAGIPLDLFQRIEVAPASLSVVRVTEQEVVIRGINLLDRTNW